MLSRATTTLLALLLVCASCRHPTPQRLRVIASTTLIASIVEAIGGDRVRVTTIAPAGFCPGHFDVPPSAVRAANEARLLINHGWEGWYPGFVAAITNPQLMRVTCRTPGNWMVPPVHREAAAEITLLLKDADPAHTATYDSAARRYATRIDSAEAEARRLLAGRELPRTICSDKQEPFLTWLGLRVIATYGRPDDFTAAELTRLARAIVDSGVGLVVDNLQSGPDAGRPLAEASGAQHVTLSNFPLSGSYPEQLLVNVRALAGKLSVPDSGPPPAILSQ